MRVQTLLALCLAGTLAALVSAPAAARAQSSTLKIQAQLIWGSDEAKSPNPAHKPVAGDVLKRLKALPLKWTNYFEVNRKDVALAAKTTEKVVLSPKCAIEIRSLGGEEVEVALYGKGEKVVKRTQVLPKGEILVLGGNAPGETAWLVVLKRAE